MSSNFNCHAKNDVRIMSLKFAKVNPENMSYFFLIIFVGIPHVCVASAGSKFS